MIHNTIVFKPFLFSVLLITVLASCTLSEPAKIIGSWTGISWEVNGREDSGRVPEMVSFTFQTDMTYTASIGRQSEAGVYRLEQQKLYTTADGMEEKMVEIKLPAPDTLIMLMNRMGVPEKLTLVRN